jgi:DNA-binding NarL/FixJ family response regulator
MNETVKKNLALIAKQSKSERLYRKLSIVIEVLRYLSGGKKNHEIAEILGLNENNKYIQIALLTKLNVTNLVDLVNKAKKLNSLIKKRDITLPSFF